MMSIYFQQCLKKHFTFLYQINKKCVNELTLLFGGHLEIKLPYWLLWYQTGSCLPVAYDIRIMSDQVSYVFSGMSTEPI